jgi:hypothetical protein
MDTEDIGHWGEAGCQQRSNSADFTPSRFDLDQTLRNLLPASKNLLALGIAGWR